MKQILFLPLFLALFVISALAQSNSSATLTPNTKEFVGQYVYSSGYVGANYKLIDDGKFEYSTFSDCCDPVWRESGTYTFKDNQLHFKVSIKTLNEYNLLDSKQATEAFRKIYKDKDADVKAGDIETVYNINTFAKLGR